jgi:hypothetical protein
VKSDGVSVTSARLGFDVYMDLMKKENWELKALAFGFGERLLLERDAKTIAESSSDLAIRQFGFNLLFIGGGVTVSW